MTAAPAPSGPPWVQILLTVVGLLGGLGGVAAVAGVILQRRKFKADAADVLTDTALTLVEPLRARLAEVEQEATSLRKDLRAVRTEAATLAATLRRWRQAILDPDATLERLRALVEHGPGENGRPRT